MLLFTNDIDMTDRIMSQSSEITDEQFSTNLGGKRSDDSSLDRFTANHFREAHQHLCNTVDTISWGNLRESLSDIIKYSKEESDILNAWIPENGGWFAPHLVHLQPTLAGNTLKVWSNAIREYSLREEEIRMIVSLIDGLKDRDPDTDTEFAHWRDSAEALYSHCTGIDEKIGTKETRLNPQGILPEVRRPQVGPIEVEGLESYVEVSIQQSPYLAPIFTKLEGESPGQLIISLQNLGHPSIMAGSNETRNSESDAGAKCDWNEVRFDEIFPLTMEEARNSCNATYSTVATLIVPSCVK